MAACKTRMEQYADAIDLYEKALCEDNNRATRNALNEVKKLKEKKEREAYINPELAEQHREKGNEYFKEGNYPAAKKGAARCSGAVRTTSAREPPGRLRVARGGSGSSPHATEGCWTGNTSSVPGSVGGSSVRYLSYERDSFLQTNPRILTCLLIRSRLTL